MGPHFVNLDFLKSTTTAEVAEDELLMVKSRHHFFHFPFFHFLLKFAHFVQNFTLQAVFDKNQFTAPAGNRDHFIDSYWCFPNFHFDFH